MPLAQSVAGSSAINLRHRHEKGQRVWQPRKLHHNDFQEFETAATGRWNLESV